ncbi:MAG: hypothetical protein LH477_03765, partial [Nocardioides sp.]|nr:hypothetical protein [Nocardioides sp.]
GQGLVVHGEAHLDIHVVEHFFMIQHAIELGGARRVGPAPAIAVWGSAFGDLWPSGPRSVFAELVAAWGSPWGTLRIR